MSPATKVSNKVISKDGLMLYSRGQLFHTRRIYKLLQKNEEAAARKKATPPPPAAADERPVRKPCRKVHYPTETVRRTRKIAARQRHRLKRAATGQVVAKPKLKSSLKPGVICIVLAGCQVGKRVVFLKQMERSGLALVTGPYKLNGCPLRRVNQVHLMPTSFTIDLSKVEIPEAVNDEMLKRHDQKKKRAERRKRLAFSKGEKKVAESLFGEEGDQEEGDQTISKEEARFRLPDKVRKERMEVQKVVDAQVIGAVSEQFGRVMKRYLASKFHIDNSVYPHRLRF